MKFHSQKQGLVEWGKIVDGLSEVLINMSA